jgi:hypothetical protein
MSEKYPPIIAIDFDMTISNNRDYKDLRNPPMPGATEVIPKLKELGCILILWTCRGGNDLLEAKEYLKKYDLLQYFSYFNEDTADIKAAFGDDGKKIYADAYIDDKNLGGFPGWGNVLPKVMDIIYLKEGLL